MSVESASWWYLLRCSFLGDISSLQYFSGWTWYLDQDWRNVKTQESEKNKSRLSVPYFIICLNVFSKTKTKHRKKEKLLVIFLSDEWACCRIVSVFTNNTARNMSLFIYSVYNGEGRADRDGARLTSQPSLSPGDFSPRIALWKQSLSGTNLHGDCVNILQPWHDAICSYSLTIIYIGAFQIKQIYY